MAHLPSRMSRFSAVIPAFLDLDKYGVWMLWNGGVSSVHVMTITNFWRNKTSRCYSAWRTLVSCTTSRTTGRRHGIFNGPCKLVGNMSFVPAQLLPAVKTPA